MSLAKAVYDAIQQLGTNGGIAGAKLAKHLLAQGFVPQGKNFKTSVGITLRRLSEQERIATELKDGKRLYMVKK